SDRALSLKQCERGSAQPRAVDAARPSDRAAGRRALPAARLVVPPLRRPDAGGSLRALAGGRPSPCDHAVVSVVRLLVRAKRDDGRRGGPLGGARRTPLRRRGAPASPSL